MKVTMKFKLLFCALLSGFFCGGVIAGDRNEQNVVHEHAALSARDIEAFEVVEDSRYQIKRDFAQQIRASIAAFHKISVQSSSVTISVEISSRIFVCVLTAILLYTKIR